MKRSHKNVIMICALSLFPLSAMAAMDDAKAAKGEERRAAMFAKSDTNSDGKISKDEFGAKVQARSDKFFSKFDTNSDGNISKAEMNAVNKERAEKRFVEMDANKDGSLTKDELKTYRETHRGKHWDKKSQ